MLSLDIPRFFVSQKIYTGLLEYQYE
jgi:hypothetical protein